MPVTGAATTCVLGVGAVAPVLCSVFVVLRNLTRAAAAGDRIMHVVLPDDSENDDGV